MNRRQFLWSSGGLGGIALSHLMAQESGKLHHAPKAKRVVQLFMSGAASQCDLFDYKPLLDKKVGEPWDPGEKVELFQSKPGMNYSRILKAVKNLNILSSENNRSPHHLLK